MKKIISLLLAFVLMVSSLSCISVAASDLEFYTVGDYTVESGTSFNFEVPEDGYYRFESYDNSDPYIEIYFDGTEYCYYDDRDDGDYEFEVVFYMLSGDVYECKVEDWGEYDINFEISYIGTEYDGPVYEGDESDEEDYDNIDSIEFISAQPLTLRENAWGNWVDIQDEDNKYFEYDVLAALCQEDNSLILHMDGGTSVEYFFDFDNYTEEIHSEYDDWNSFVITDNQNEEHWYVGNTYYFELKVEDTTVEIPVTIIDNNIESVVFDLVEPLEFIEETDGYWTWDDCNNDYFHYDVYPKVFAEGNTVEVFYKDGTSKVYTADFSEQEYVFCDENGEYLNISVYEYVQTDNPWLLGNTYNLSVKVDGYMVELPVEIVETPAKSLKFTSARPISIVENLNGFWDDCENGDCEGSYFYYYASDALAGLGNCITIEFNDGTTKKLVYDTYQGIFMSSDEDEYISYDFFTNQDDEHWVVGGKHNITIRCYGLSVDVPVTIIENPVKSIKFVPTNPITVVENVDGEWDYYYDEEYNEQDMFWYDIYDHIFSANNTLILTYKDGTTKKAYWDEESYDFFCTDTDLIEVDFNTHQYANPWQVNKTYNVDVFAYGLKTTVPVTVIPAKPATPKVTTTNEMGGVNITWNKVVGATKYVVYRRQGGSNTWVNIGTTTGTSLFDKNVKSGIFYVYSVRAYNRTGAYSDFVSANTSTRKYMAVPKLTGISNATNGLYIKWNAVAGVTKGYRVYRRGAGSTYWTYLGTVKTTYYTDTSVKNASGNYYRYTVIADGVYHSKFDTAGLYLKRLANPSLTSATSTKAGITVKWGAVKGTTGYYVYRKTANSSWQRIAAVGGTNTTSFVDKTAKKGTTYTYTVRACSGYTLSYFNSGIRCYDKY